MSEVVLDGITKRFGDVTAVDDLTLDIVDDELMVLLGPSGCGKTTALRMVAGLETITSGTLTIGDRVVNDVEAKDRDISMVFQSYALYPHMTVRRNIESPLVSRKMAPPEGGAPRKLTKTERTERIAEASRILDLDSYLDRKPAALSGGQRQRVALARAIVGRPKAFLMDEPLSNLDAKLRAQTRLELVELHQRLATTFIYVTHDQVEAMTMATRIAVMQSGRLQQVGAPQEVYERPTNLFVARFIGNPPMNTVPGSFVVEDGEAFVDLGTGRFPLSAAGGDFPVTSPDVIVGVRPEHLAVGGGPIEAKVSAVEWLGHESHVICTVGETRIIVRQASGDATPNPGDTLQLTADPTQIHLFDPVTTKRLN